MEEKRHEMSSDSAKILIKTIEFFAKATIFMSSLAFNPLFSFVIAFYSLILLYFPRNFLDLVLSPVLISTGILLSTLLRLGAIQGVENEKKSRDPGKIDSPNEDHKWVRFITDTETETETEKGFGPKRFQSDSFVEWNVKAPLEVIYEEYDGEEEDDFNKKEDSRVVGIERLVSLSLYCSESDSESSSGGDFSATEEWDWPENMCFRWGEVEREEMIEIPLDGKRNWVYQVEEENLIEIEISPVGAPARSNEFNGKF
ncbi:hypothetical protein HHK36_003778 [Tetracentron sinense]|uniref:Uncharacterized protein n=1 Tax=Tetracentron sinense TaxID=13715 RepID=A0A834ZYJ5_TETSI|nr:hypothetical protein HHK36_003778 [Tetracentron sinense]